MRSIPALVTLDSLYWSGAKVTFVTHDAVVIGAGHNGLVAANVLADAAIVSTADDARALLAAAVQDDLGAIGSYIAPVTISNSGEVQPGNLREQVRARGVTIELPVDA